MVFYDFKNKFYKLVCFISNQVYAIYPDFNKNNLTNWVKKGYLIKLRNGYYTFPEYQNKHTYHLYIANRIYRPSYISTHTALAFYGLIPEGVIQITSVSNLKTAMFENQFGSYIYQTIHQELMFGFEHKPFAEGFNLLIACPEKAILDLFYLNSFYNTIEDFHDLRLDMNMLEELTDNSKMDLFLKTYKNKRIEHLINNLFKSI